MKAVMVLTCSRPAWPQAGRERAKSMQDMLVFFLMGKDGSVSGTLMLKHSGRCGLRQHLFSGKLLLLMSWSRNWPNCITMLLTLSSGLSRSGNAPATTRTLGRSSAGPDPRGLKSWEYLGAANRLNGMSAAPQLGFWTLLHLPSTRWYDDAKSQGVDYNLSTVIKKYFVGLAQWTIVWSKSKQFDNRGNKPENTCRDLILFKACDF